MVLTDEVVDRVHRLSIEVLRLTARGVFAVRPDAAEADLEEGYALFAGEGSPLTQVVGFGHRSPGNAEEIERFFAAKADNWEVAVTPLTNPASVAALTQAGYRPSHFEGELAQCVESVPDVPRHEIVEVDTDLESWMDATGRGWCEDEASPFVPDELVRAVAAMPGRRYLALVDGVPAATASMYEFGDSVVLGGAATRVPYRGKGLQSALLARRLRDAGRGRFALIGAMPGTTSFRNAQRMGFTPLYSKMTFFRR